MRQLTLENMAAAPIYNSMGEFLGSFNTKQAEQNLLLCYCAFDQVGLRPWLLYGTLLGAYRDGGLIAYDRDVDLGCFADDLPQMNEALAILEKDGFSLIRVSAYMFTIVRAGEYVDINLFVRQEGGDYVTWGIYGPPDERADVPRKHFDTLDEIECFGRKFTVPSHIPDLLVRWYGPGWKTPQRGKYAYH